MRKFTDKTFKKHLEKEHGASLSSYLKEIVYGGSDGIITTFSVVAGFTGAQSGGALTNYPVLIVLIFGFANLFADGFSMGVGNVLSTLANKDVYKTKKDRELHEIKNSPELEKNETIYLLQKKGFSKEDSEKLTQLYSKNEDYWAEFMMRYELEMPTPEHDNPILSGVATMGSFVIFGFIPLIPYVLLSGGDKFTVSVFFALIAMILLGILRWKVTTQTILRSVGETVGLGGIAALIAYFIGTMFK